MLDEANVDSPLTAIPADGTFCESDHFIVVSAIGPRPGSVPKDVPNFGDCAIDVDVVLVSLHAVSVRNERHFRDR